MAGSRSELGRGGVSNFKVLRVSFRRQNARLSARPLPPLPLPSTRIASLVGQQDRLDPIVPFVPHPFLARSAAATDSSDQLACGSLGRL